MTKLRCVPTASGKLPAWVVCLASLLLLLLPPPPPSREWHQQTAATTKTTATATTGIGAGVALAWQTPSSARKNPPPSGNRKRRISQSRPQPPPAAAALHMGLYDDPLPPRPPPVNDDRKRKNEGKNTDDDDDDEDDVDLQPPRLFSFDSKGREVNDLLPPLGRRLDSGIGCYFEPSDRKVRNLIDKASPCHADDACWALEACKGDLTEAWTRISTARRLSLNRQRAARGEDDYFSDDDLRDLELEEEFEERKAARAAEAEKKRMDENDVRRMFEGGPPDQEWLPRPNPKPVDDEPWFTG